MDITEIHSKLREKQKSFAGEVLTFAQASLHPQQFKAFKKLLFESLHERLIPESKSILIDELHRVRSGQCHNIDNFDRKEC